MGKIIIGLIIGLLIGGVATFYFFIGVPRAAETPGRLIQAPDTETPAGSAMIVLRQEFFNEILTTIFRDMNAPAFPLGSDAISATPSSCDSRITIVKEGSGVQTTVRFEDNRISAPLAFNGSYNSPIGCFQFTGWAQTNLELRFDTEQQIVFGRINVQTVNLDGVNPIISGLVTPLVQTTLNERVNPIPVLS
ncbi:MAG: hypothetical protein ABIV48_08985, partial [Pyrinomonadaceae bacterium]